MISTIYESPIGPIQLLVDQKALVALWFKKRGKVEGCMPNSARLRLVSSPELKPFIKWLDSYFQGQADNTISFPLNPLYQTTFRQKVWHILKEIPYGKTMTYGEIASMLEAQTHHMVSAQAVGGAIAANPILLIIPCHRVLSASGDLTGYSGGIEKKAWLLNHEQIFRKDENHAN